MKLSRLIILLLVLFQIGAFSQPTHWDCPLDTSRKFQLNIELYGKLYTEANQNDVGTSLNYADFRKEGWLPCSNFAVEILDSLQSYKILERYWTDSSWFSDTVIVPFEKLKIASVYIDLTTLGSWEGMEHINLDQIYLLQKLELPDLNSIIINNQYDNSNFSVNLSKWPSYKDLVKQNSLERFGIYGYFDNEEVLKDIEPFTNLKKLSLPDILCYDVSRLESLEEYSFSWIDFPHQLVQLENLSWKNDFFGNIYAIKRFFLENLLLKQTPIGRDHISVYTVPFLNQVIRENLPQKLNKDGFVVITRTELPNYYEWLDQYGRRNQYSHSVSANDTVISGNIVDGKMRGIWRYNLYGKWRGANSFYNYDIEQQKMFPKNGLWQYRFHNDTIAISGEFKNGRKNGVWKFFLENGDLQCTMLYEDDKLKLITHRSSNYSRSRIGADGKNYRVTCEERTYYFSCQSNDCLRVYSCPDSIVEGIYDSRLQNMDTYHKSFSNSRFAMRDSLGFQLRTHKDGLRYNDYLYENYLKYLFPEFKKGDCPYRVQME